MSNDDAAKINETQTNEKNSTVTTRRHWKSLKQFLPRIQAKHSTTLTWCPFNKRNLSYAESLDKLLNVGGVPAATRSIIGDC